MLPFRRDGLILFGRFGRRGRRAKLLCDLKVDDGVVIEPVGAALLRSRNPLVAVSSCARRNGMERIRE